MVREWEERGIAAVERLREGREQGKDRTVVARGPGTSVSRGIENEWSQDSQVLREAEDQPCKGTLWLLDLCEWLPLS